MRNTCVMGISVNEAARRQGISAQRVRAQIKGGRLRAERHGRDWDIDPADLPREVRRSRPMSQRMADAFIAAGVGEPLAKLSAKEAARLRSRLEQLCNSDDPASLLRAWLASREQRLCLEARDLDFLRADERLVLAGVSLPQSGLNSAGFLEAYVNGDDIAPLMRRHMMREASPSKANVVLHVVNEFPLDPGAPLRLAADLASHNNRSLREDARVAELLRLLP